MGSQHYFSSRSKHPNGNWNEGFIFTISYHNQLFDTIELDLYDRRTKWRSKTKHIGKAKLKIGKLKERDDVFITFLPMYEYHVKRYLPAHIQLPHTFLKSHMPSMSKIAQYRYGLNKLTAKVDEEESDPDLIRLMELPPYQIHPSHNKHSMTPFIGSIQVRVRYSFQHPPDTESDTLSSFYFEHTPIRTISVDSFSLRSRSKASQRSSIYSSSSTTSSTASGSTAYSRPNHSELHDAVEPNLALVDELIRHTSSIKPKISLPRSDSSVEMMFGTKLDQVFEAHQDHTSDPHKKKVVNLEEYQVDFPKMDGENKKKNEVLSDTASIKSHNFGDKNFAFRWINESFEEVALSHPSLDRMIGLVVSPQTRILLRAVVKMCNAFGQGFKITIIQLISSLSLLQNFYSEVPRPPPAEKITDLKFLDEAYYFLGHAIIAYIPEDPPEDLLGYEYGLRKGAVFQPSYFISYDQGHEAVVLGIRGTWSLYDCITDLVCEYRPWKGGLVHSGMLASAQWFFTRIIPQIFLFISEQIESKNRRISSFIITGHSLGAGTAAILTMMVADHIDQLRDLSQNPHFKVHCYSYAPVASVSLDLSEKYKNHIDSFVCHDDLVGRLSYGTASCAKELIMDSLIAADGLGGTTKRFTMETNPVIPFCMFLDVFSNLDVN
ncbi:hypothetical protein BDB01DRAFT_843157 [Pilobolus umbonatus]|nr:hypothetical protein BDB01DRAFT_843157 [Pilobolus umbonatus]